MVHMWNCEFLTWAHYSDHECVPNVVLESLDNVLEGRRFMQLSTRSQASLVSAAGQTFFSRQVSTYVTLVMIYNARG